jgi:serine/threonine protein kinase
VILFALLTGNLPFQDDFAPRLQMKIMRGMYDESLLGKRSVSLGARDVIKKCLQVKENERWTIRQLVDSTWLQQGPAELLMGKGTARAPETP